MRTLNNLVLNEHKLVSYGHNLVLLDFDTKLCIVC